MCTELKGKNSYFLPFNKGNNNGAGNPVNESGIKTDYLWKEILTKSVLSNILENYVQITEDKDGTNFSISGNKIQTSLEIEVLSLARSLTLSKR